MGTGPSPGAGDTPWVAQPELSDERITAATGRGWNDWVSLIDAGPGRSAGHTAIATWLRDEHDVDGWWAQSVTVGYERITGIRLPGQMPDGTFSISRSRTMPGDVPNTRMAFLDDASRAALLPELASTLRSRPDAKELRFSAVKKASGQDVGRFLVAINPAAAGVQLVITHEKLPSYEAAEQWKDFWGSWIAGLEAPLAPPR